MKKKEMKPIEMLAMEIGGSPLPAEAMATVYMGYGLVVGCCSRDQKYSLAVAFGSRAGRLMPSSF